MTDMLERIRKELDQRLVALRPSVKEYERLLGAADALAGIAPGATSRSTSARAAAPSPAPRRRAPAAKRARAAKPSAGARARPGQTQQRVIEVLGAQPGIRSSAVAREVGISANAAAATISRLVKQGRARRRETGGYEATEPATQATAGMTAPAAVVTPDPAAAPASASVAPSPTEPAAPEPAVPEVAAPEPAAPEAAAPEPAAPEVAEPEVAEPDAAEPDPPAADPPVADPGDPA